MEYKEFSDTKSQAATDAGEITLKVKLIDGTTKEVPISPEADVAELKRAAFPEQMADPGKNVKLICFGKMMKDGDKLSVYKVQDGTFVHGVI